MNTKLYKQVFNLAGELLDAAENDQYAVFEQLYASLKQLCEQYEHDENNHPVLWETLADFTGDSELALSLYQKALDFALAQQATDYIASISYAMAILLQEDEELQGQQEPGLCLDLAKQAESYAAKADDNELQTEIKQLLSDLS
jgi:hypothetical protein